MFNILTKYKHKNRFTFKTTDSLSNACNAPTDKSGVYLVYALKKGQKELIYIGRSGELKEGSMFVRKAGIGGIKDRIVNGKQFDIPRRKSWPAQMLKENIEALEIHWYVTHDNTCIDCPKTVEGDLLKEYLLANGQLPKWNKTA